MGVVGFGRELFKSEDLDPIYTDLLRLELPREQLVRWLISYWCQYHAGFSSFASEYEGVDFWDLLAESARNTTDTPFGTRWPRGIERRYFRGTAAVGAIAGLRKRYGKRPEDMIDYLMGGSMGVRAVIERVQTHTLFGSWIGFKVADMLDAVLEVDVDQDEVSIFLYDTPRQSILEKLAALPIDHSKDEASQCLQAMFWLQHALKDCRIPHKKHQKPDWFALETVWCKHLSHMHGHYPIGNDIREIKHGILPWTKISKTAERFLKCMPVTPVKPGELF